MDPKDLQESAQPTLIFFYGNVYRVGEPKLKLFRGFKYIIKEKQTNGPTWPALSLDWQLQRCH